MSSSYQTISPMTERKFRYLISNEADKAWGMLVTTCGQQKIAKDSEYPPSKHPMRYAFNQNNGRILNEFQLVYISEGKGEFISSSSKRKNISEGDIIVLFPGEWHNYRPCKETGWHESWIGFASKDMESKVKAGFFSKDNPVLHVGVDSELYNLFNMACNTANIQEPFYHQKLAGIASMIIGMVYSKSKQSSTSFSEAEAMVSKAKIAIFDNLDHKFSGEEIAERIGCSYTKFRKIFKQYTGFSPMQYTQELRISKARQLLSNTDMSCQQISYDCGFETPSFFHVIFRKKTGMSPVEFRNKMKYNTTHQKNRNNK